MRTHYDNLHVSEKASQEVIKAAYKALAQKWHPDKHATQREKAERYFKIITRAFEVLSDAEARREYDTWLKDQRKADESAAAADPEKQPPEFSSTPKSLTEAWDEGYSSPSLGLTENDCPYTGELAAAWRHGFASRVQAARKSPAKKEPWLIQLWEGKVSLGITFLSLFVAALPVIFILSFIIAFIKLGADSDFREVIRAAQLIYVPYILLSITCFVRASYRQKKLPLVAMTLVAACSVTFAISQLNLDSSKKQNIKSSQIEFDPTTAVLVPDQHAQPKALTASDQATQDHFELIMRAHPDFSALLESQRFINWVSWSDARTAILARGTTQEIIAMADDYKARLNEYTAEIDKYLEQTYRVYPGLNYEGSRPNTKAIEEVVAIQNALIKDGTPAIDALQIAVNKVAIRRKWIYPIDSLPK